MATKMLERPMTKRNDASVKIDAAAVAEAKIAAAILGQTLAEFLSDAATEKAARVTAEYKSSGSAKPAKPKGGKA